MLKSFTWQQSTVLLSVSILTSSFSTVGRTWYVEEFYLAAKYSTPQCIHTHLILQYSRSYMVCWRVLPGSKVLLSVSILISSFSTVGRTGNVEEFYLAAKYSTPQSIHTQPHLSVQQVVQRIMQSLPGSKVLFSMSTLNLNLHYMLYNVHEMLKSLPGSKVLLGMSTLCLIFEDILVNNAYTQKQLNIYYI